MSDPRTHAHLTLTDMLREHARQRPEQTACVVLDGYGEQVAAATYRELDEAARRTAALLQQVSTPGDRALVLYPNGLEFVTAFFACAYAGVIAVPVPCPDTLIGGHRTLARLESIVKDADPAVVLTTHEIAASPGPELGTGQRIVVDDVSAALADLWVPPPSDPATPAFLQYTSGSTSAPKGAVISHASVLANIAAIRVALRADTVAPEDFRMVSWLPLFHDLGLGHLLVGLEGGGQVVLLAPGAFLMRPLVWLRAIGEYRGLVASAPNFAYDLCVRRVPPDQRATLDLRSWRFALNGAEPVRPDTLERFADAFGPAGFDAGSFLPCYGMAEATVFVSGTREPGDARWAELDVAALEQERRLAEPTGGAPSRRIVACGRPGFNLDVRIVDPQRHTELGAEKVGEIWVAGDSVAGSYWQQPEASAQRFGGELAELPGVRFLRTGDLGFLRDGQVYPLGRLDDLIIVDGRNHYPQDIELTVGACHPALAPNMCAAFGYPGPDGLRIGVVVESARRARIVEDDREPAGPDEFRATDVAAAVRGAVSDEHQIRVDSVVLLRPGGLPRTTSGKVQRNRSRELLLAGTHRTW